MTALDNCVSNNLTNEISASDKYGKKLKVLFNWALNGKLEKKWNTFVYDTFQCFIKNKKKISIDMFMIQKYVHDEDLLNLMFYSTPKTQVMEGTLLTNLIRPIMFKIFENVEEIEIISDWNYGFSLFGFLDIIKKTKIKTATISARIRGGLLAEELSTKKKSWIDTGYMSQEQNMMDTCAYVASNFNIVLKQVKSTRGQQDPTLGLIIGMMQQHIDTLKITKM